jgi:predicted ATPase
MSNYVKRIAATGLYGHFELQQEFYPGVNVLYGQNGSGKSTLLHILANALNGNYERFAYLPFDSIQIELDDDVLIVLKQDKKRPDFHVLVNGKPRAKDVLTSLGEGLEYLPFIQVNILKPGRDSSTVQPLLPTAYFPAFRNMIDAWSFRADELGVLYHRQHSTHDCVRLARRLFGKFVPEISYISAFEMLASRTNGQAKDLAPYLMTVNSFLCGKTLLVNSKQLKLKFADDEHYQGLEALSSGERHLMSMLYTASLQSQYNLILIDEPEMSFHIDWQERLLKEMMEQKAGRQLIVCTHSPMIGVEYEDRMMELRLSRALKRRGCKEKVPA